MASPINLTHKTMNNITLLKNRLNEFVGKELSLEEDFTKTLLERELERLQKETNNLWYTSAGDGTNKLKAIPFTEVSTDHLINIIGYCLRHGYTKRCETALKEFIRRDYKRAFTAIYLFQIYEALAVHSVVEAKRFQRWNNLTEVTTFVEFIQNLLRANYNEYQYQIYFWTIRSLV